MPRRRSVVAVVMVSIAGAASVSEAADREVAWSVAVGDRVRLRLQEADRSPVVGEVTAVDERAVVLRARTDGEPLRLSWTAIEDAQRSLGRRTHRGRGAATGAVALGIPMFVLSGLAGGACICIDECPRNRCQPHFSAPFGAAGMALGGGVGAALGVAIGSFKTEDWRRVGRRRPELSLSVAPQPRGGGATLAVRF